MIPAVKLPDDGKIKTPLDLKLKPGWRYDAARRIFLSDDGDRFEPVGKLPKRTRIKYKVPSLVEANIAELSEPEKDLRRYMQIILPAGESPADYRDEVNSWDCVEEARVAPQISLPMQF